MTIKEAIANGIYYVRLPEWNPDAHLELPVADENGFHGPWATLNDGPPRQILLCQLGGDDQYEEWPADPTARN